MNGQGSLFQSLLAVGLCCVTLSGPVHAYLESQVNKSAKEQQVELGDYTFYFVVGTDDYVTYFDAVRLCEERNLTLVSLEIQEKDNLLTEFIAQNEEFDVWLWTSGWRPAGSEKWSWSSNGMQMIYTRWASGEPNQPIYNETCMNFMMSRNGWDDDLCEIKLSSYLCELLPQLQSPDDACTIGTNPFYILLMLAFTLYFNW